MLFFFFSSRRRHTRWTGDWSSDVCSSDLAPGGSLLQGDAHLVDLQDLLGAALLDAHAAGEPLHQPVLLQPREALPDGRAADAELAGERRLGERLASLQLVAEDQLTQPLVGRVRHVLPFDGRIQQASYGTSEGGRLAGCVAS